jgi:hypothetical protein
VASFVNVGLTATPGTSAQLTFSAPGLSAAASSVTVGALPATQLVVITAPSVVVPNGSALPIQPRIQLRDASGAAVLLAGVPITAIIVETNGGPATLAGTVTMNTASDGVATFTNLAITSSAPLVRLRFSSPGLTGVSANETLVQPGPASAILASGGAGQRALFGTVLPVRPAAKVTDMGGLGIPGVTVTFVVTAGGGALASTSAGTNAEGIATAGLWTLGPAAGTHAVTATTAAVVGGSATIESIALPTLALQRIAGGDAGCGVGTDGGAYCFGPPTTLVPGGLAFTSLSSRGGHVCGIVTGGAVWCWGSNASGQLGDGTFTSRTTPVLVSGGLQFQQVSAGYDHTCGVTVAGAAYCWGNNSASQIGQWVQRDDPGAGRRARWSLVRQCFRRGAVLVRCHRSGRRILLGTRQLWPPWHRLVARHAGEHTAGRRRRIDLREHLVGLVSQLRTDHWRRGPLLGARWTATS